MGKTSAKDIEYQEILTKAVKLRLAKIPFDQIIAELGHWNSVQACQKAVSGHLKRNQFKKIEDSRAEAIAILEKQLSVMRVKFERAHSRFDSAEIRKLVREISLLNGDYAPQKVAETDTKGNDVVKSITVNVVKSASVAHDESHD